MTQDDISARISEIGELLAERLGCRGRTLEAQVRRAGRSLPRSLAREARYLAQVEGIVINPKLFRMIDQQRVTLAHRLLKDHLKAVDPAERRKTRLINIAALVALNLLIVVVLVISVLIWRDLV